MAPAYRDDSHLIIQPGSQNTLITFGLEESLALPKYSVPTKVYKSTATGLYTLTGDAENLTETELIYPIVKGEIVDVNALNFLFKMILKDVVKKNPFIILNNITLSIVQTSSKWSNLAIESITKYVFETLEISSFTILPLGLCSMFSHGSYANSCIIDIGHEKTEIYPVINYQIYPNGISYIPLGSQSINDELTRLLPNLKTYQIEELKKSQIFEVLNDEDQLKALLTQANIETDFDKETDEGVLDIASIVTSSNSTTEILAESKKTTNAKKAQANHSELPVDSFIDSQGIEVSVGNERFHGCQPLIDAISNKVYRSLSKIIDLKQRAECYDNIIIVGNTLKIKGLKESILSQLIKDHLVGLASISSSASSKSALQSIESQFRQTQTQTQSNSTTQSFNQVPTSIKIVKHPEYFSNWKKTGFENASFLGAQILVKQIYTNNPNDLFFVKEDYLNIGPLGIWHTML